MVCQNCGSNDIVTIQGQNYCINCGQIVTSKAPAATKITLSPTKGQPAKKVAKPKPEPKSKTVPTKLSRRVIKPIVAEPTADQPPAEPKVITPATAPKSISDVRRIEPRPAKAEIQLPDPPAPAVTQPAPVGTGFRSWIQSAQASTEAKSLVELSALSALMLAVPIILLLTGGLGWLGPSGLVSADRLRYGLSAIGAFGLAAYLIYGRFTNSLLYGIGRSLDQRPNDRGDWDFATSGAFWPSVALDGLLALAALILTVAAVLFVRIPVSYISNHSLQIAVTLVGLFAVSFLGLNLLLTRIMARSALALSRLSLSEAFTTGWEIAQEQAGRLLAVSLITLLLNGLAVLVFPLTDYGFTVLAHAANQPAAATLAPFTALLMGWWVLRRTILFSLGLWLAAYREGAKRLYPDNYAALTTGRAASRGDRWAVFTLEAVIVLLVGLLAYSLWKAGVVSLH